MLRKKEKSISEAYKRHIALIITLISCIILVIFALSLINLKKSYKDSSLVNTLGRQRMLTQMMAKDTGRIYEINSIINDGGYEQLNKDELAARQSEALKELKQSIDEYEKNYNTINDGYIIQGSDKISFSGAMKKLQPILARNEEIWRQFKASIYVVINDNNISIQTVDAMKYINENNGVILDYSNQITNVVLDYNRYMNLMVYYLFMSIIILTLIFLAIFIRNAYRDLFVPISQLANGMSNLGMAEETESFNIEQEKDVPVFSEVKTIFDRLNSIISLIENLNKNIEFKDTLQYIFHSFRKYIPYTHIGVSLISDDRKDIIGSYGVSSDKHHKNLGKRLSGFKMPLSQTSLHNIIETGEERIINDLEEYVKGKPLKEYNRILLEEGIKSSISFPLKNDNEAIGVIFFSSNVKNVYKKEHIQFLRILANSIVLSLEKNIFMEDMVISSTLALANLTEERDTETGEHLQRMKMYSRLIAEFLSKEDRYKDIIDLDYINNIEKFAPLHDIGKVAIRDDILLKPGKLTPEEFEIMKTHTSYGAKVLKMADENLNRRGRSIFKMAIEIADGHHEKWDGSGYPHRKSGEEIPLSARIVALADVLDALTSKRPYKEPFSFEQSIDIINEGSGKHFDPYIIEVLMKNIYYIKKMYLEFNRQIA